MDIFNKKLINVLQDKLNYLENVVNGVKQPNIVDRTTIIDQMQKDYAYRTKQTIKTWREALTYAEDSDNRYYLYEIFREIYLDSHIMSTILLRKSRITQLPFEIEWKDDNLNNKEEDPTLEMVDDFLDQKWFYDFLNSALDYLYEGYVALEITKIEDNNLEITKIPISHLRPMSGVFVKNKFDQTENGIKLDQDPYEQYIMEIFDNRSDLGLYTKIAPLFMWSRQAHQAWSQYSEIYGQPIRIAKTAKQDSTERKKLFDLLKNMGSSLSVVLDNQDAIEFIETSKTDAFNVYLKLIDLCNSEINKLILGATMVNEDGSSYAQSKVHQGQFDSLIKMDIKAAEHIINDILFPKLVNLGLIPEGLEFEFDTSESLSIFEKFEIDRQLLPYYEMDIEYLNKTYNTQIIGTKSTDLGIPPMDQNTNNE